MNLLFDDVAKLLQVGSLIGQPQPAFAVDSTEDFFIPPRLVAKPGVEGAAAPVAMLISARGAAGKSRVARRLSQHFGAPLWRLEADAAVSGAALEQKLTRYLDSVHPESHFSEGTSPLVVIDSLDEARTRVSGQSWNEFLESLVSWTTTGLRLAMLGRERTLEDVWVALAEKEVPLAWYEISHFDQDQRKRYVDEVARVRQSNLDTEAQIYRQTRDTIIDALAGTVGQGQSDAFVGYAPVLDAVAATLVKTNLLTVRQQFEEPGQGSRMEVLDKIIRHLLVRDQEKVAPLAELNELEPNAVYTPDEQVEWLYADLEGGPQPSLSYIADGTVRSTYATSIRTFLDDHPFRNGRTWASPVFEAWIASHRLNQLASSRLQQIGNASELLFDFVASAGDPNLIVDEYQFAALHSSALASESTLTELNAEIVDDLDDGEAARATISVSRDEQEVARQDMVVTLAQANELRLYGPLSSLSVQFAGRVVVAGPTAIAVVLGPDLYLSVDQLEIGGTSVEFGRRPSDQDTEVAAEPSVVIDVRSTPTLPALITVSPLPSSDFELLTPPEVNVPHPWYGYRLPFETDQESATNDESARFLKKLMSLARSHGHSGGRAVFIPKLQGRQALKAERFAAALNVLAAEGVVTVHPTMVWINPDWETHRFNGKQAAGQRQLEDVLSIWEPILKKIRAVI